MFVFIIDLKLKNIIKLLKLTFQNNNLKVAAEKISTTLEQMEKLQKEKVF